MKFKSVLWYLGVVLTAAALILAAVWKSWPLSIAALVLALILRATNRYIPLPKVYERMGVKNDLFEGKVKQ